jgi:hypothetical protein
LFNREASQLLSDSRMTPFAAGAEAPDGSLDPHAPPVAATANATADTPIVRRIVDTLTPPKTVACLTVSDRTPFRPEGGPLPSSVSGCIERRSAIVLHSFGPDGFAAIRTIID